MWLVRASENGCCPYYEHPTVAVVVDSLFLTNQPGQTSGETNMRKALLSLGRWSGLAILLFTTSARLFAGSQMPKQQWTPRDRNRPLPPVVTPGTPSRQEEAGVPPSDAVVIFNGSDLSNWEAVSGEGAAKWKVGKGYFE